MPGSPTPAAFVVVVAGRCAQKPASAAYDYMQQPYFLRVNSNSVSIFTHMEIIKKLTNTGHEVDEIYDTMLTIFEAANARGIAPNQAADRLVEERLRTSRPIDTE